MTFTAWGRLPRANISVATGEGVPAGLHRLAQHVVTGMGLDHGYLHMEYFDTGVYAYGFDVSGATLDVHLGRRPDLTYRMRRCAGDLLLPLPGSGRVRSITGVEELSAMPGVVEAEVPLGVGDAVRARRASHNASRYIHVVGDSVAEVEQRMRDVLTKFEIIVDQPGNPVTSDEPPHRRC